MQSNIQEVLKQSLNPNDKIRQIAENELNRYEKSIEALKYIQNNLMISTDPTVKQISCIFFANSIAKNFKEPELAQLVDSLKTSLVSLLFTEDTAIIHAYEKILLTFYENSKTKEVLILLSEASKYLEDSEDNKRYAALRVYEFLFKSDSLRYELKPMFQLVFNENGEKLMRIYEESLQSQKWKICKTVQKILSRSYTYFKHPEFLCQISVFQACIGNAVKIGTMKIDPRDTFAVKTHKWAVYFLLRTVQKGTRKSFKVQEFSDLVSDPITLNVFVKVFGFIIENYSKDIVYTNRSLVYAAQFFDHMFSKKKTRASVIAFSNTLLSSFIIKSLKFDYKIEELMECDPGDYLQERYNFHDFEVRGAASQLFYSMVENKGELENEIINLMIDRLKDSKTDSCDKYAIFWLLGTTQNSMKRVLGDVEFEKFIVEVVFGHLKIVQSSPVDLALLSQALYFMNSVDDVSIYTEVSLEILKIVYELFSHPNPCISVESLWL